MADPVVPPKKLSLVREYMDEVQRIDQAQRAKKRFRNVEGFPFWPHEFVRDMIFICFFMAVLFALSGFIPYYLEAPANPAGQPQVILPDWYLLWSYGLLKIAFDVMIPVPGEDIMIMNAKVFGVVLNAVVIAPLIFLPFIHPGHARRPVEDPLWAAIGAGGVMLAMTLSVYAIAAGVIYVLPGMAFLANIKFIGWELGAWLTVLLPVATFFVAYVPLKWRQSILGYENKLSRNYFRIR